jgi:predicted O-methyltransferase YrrM
MKSNPLEKSKPPEVFLPDKTLDEKFSKEVSPACLALYKATMEKPEFRPDEVSGLQVGRTLQIFARNARNVLEIGTLTGLGTLFIAEALPDGGKVTTIDLENGPAQELGRKYWNMSGVAGKIATKTGDALVVIPEFKDGELDLVFIDGQNIQYQEYLDAVLSKMRSGSIVIIDDTLDGDLSNPSTERDRRTLEFNQKLAKDPRFISVVALNVGEGITIAIKK